jgi:guanylate kinase
MRAGQSGIEASKIKNQKSTIPTGPLFILSGPSGSGKSTVLERLLAKTALPLHVSVSATTRLPRGGEVDGQHYHFWTRERFEEARRAGAFVEWAEVHGALYGTLRSEVDPYRAEGQGVILDIDVQGAAQVRRMYPDSVSIFLRTHSLETYEARLRHRRTDSEEAIRRRLATAAHELAQAGEYDYQVINEDLDTAVAEVDAIVRRQFERGNHAG